MISRAGQIHRIRMLALWWLAVFIATFPATWVAFYFVQPDGGPIPTAAFWGGHLISGALAVWAFLLGRRVQPTQPNDLTCARGPLAAEVIYFALWLLPVLG